ncbi:MAG: hypothetical protein ACK4L7_08820 [Flavobacteriales bacterium]
MNNEAAGQIANESKNTALGHLALKDIVPTLPLNGLQNTAIGAEAMLSNVSGIQNTAAGCQALRQAKGGSRNTAVGVGCMANSSGVDCTAVGVPGRPAAARWRRGGCGRYHLGGFIKPVGPYRIAVRHRNHLGVLTASGILLGPATTVVDLSNGSVPTHGTQAQRVQDGYHAF